jgi:hypothetical protein
MRPHTSQHTHTHTHITTHTHTHTHTSQHNPQHTTHRELWTQLLQEMQPTKRERADAMKVQVQTLKTARESRRLDVAREKTNEANLLSNPDIRAIDSERFRKHVEDEREIQILAQRLAEEQRAREEDEYLRRKEQEARAAEQQEVEKERERHRKAEDHLSALHEQVEALRLKEEEADLLRVEQDKVAREQERIYREEQARERKEETERRARYSRSLHTQHKAQMLKRSREIQESLEADLRCVRCVVLGCAVRLCLFVCVCVLFHASRSHNQRSLPQAARRSGCGGARRPGPAHREAEAGQGRH